MILPIGSYLQDTHPILPTIMFVGSSKHLSVLVQE